jgi:hypothetical protein
VQSHSIKFADLFAEETREVLLHMDLTAAAAEGQQTLIKVRSAAAAAAAWHAACKVTRGTE